MDSKRKFGFRKNPDLPDWYKSIMYQLGFIKINGTERNYYVNLTDGIICRVTHDGKLKALRDGATPKQYGRVKLKMKDGSFKSFYVHRLIGDYIPNPDNKPIINHKRLDKDKNSIYDLEWVTQKENMQDYYRHKKEELNERNSG